MKSNKNLKVGDVFTVPLRDKQTVTGLIISLSKGRGIKTVFGYFFTEPPEVVVSAYQSGQLRKENSVYACMFSGLGFVDDDWKVIDNIPNFPVESWEHYEFRNQSLTSGAWRKSIYNKNFKLIDMINSSEDECKDLYEDGLSGYGAVQGVLNSVVLDKKPLPKIKLPKELLKRI
ncbi:Imm26 family immunity protein [Marinibactrum halimedae]|uniref:Uncharacterized protein n=1 Tax=Marinibactrum halimedae TaxID=1444977 RepID=A0AA37T6B6_9GAMM|nr:Imm26 family immunity protein [Marinibactrum halimedae]MCD9461255.1 immunity 26/phosphotriesterase HocA family protein [Marinibactrum halimedae]GLS27584.1 hypothetical protein GCM10007877_33030 [Marinibactrum halimedae]